MVYFLSKVTALKTVISLAKTVLWTLASSGAVSVADSGMQKKNDSSLFYEVIKDTMNQMH